MVTGWPALHRSCSEQEDRAWQWPRPFPQRRRSSQLLQLPRALPPPKGCLDFKPNPRNTGCCGRFFFSSFAFFGGRQYWISNFPFHLAYTITVSRIQLRQCLSTGMTLPPRDMWQHLEAFALAQLGGQGKRVACRGQRPGMLRTAQPRNRESSGSGVHGAKAETPGHGASGQVL